MTFTGNEEHSISYEEASKLTQEYQSQQVAEYIKGHFFGRDSILKILNQDNCVGIRFYYGLNDGKDVLVLVGVDSKENDLINGEIMEKGFPCPPYCGETNKLNSK
ncbi:MAG: hypothetical protein FJ213_09040 [Ignavibacteria bacterium]|nr:hypothetical protein [Ignavibacteria bacterium]